MDAVMCGFSYDDGAEDNDQAQIEAAARVDEGFGIVEHVGDACDVNADFVW